MADEMEDVKECRMTLTRVCAEEVHLRYPGTELLGKHHHEHLGGAVWNHATVTKLLTPATQFTD